MRLSNRPLLAIAAIALVAAALAGCGSNSSTTTTTSVANKSVTQSTSAAAGATTIGTKSSSLGTILAGDKNMTVYLFEADTTSKSTCDGACAAAWPPVLTNGSPTASGGAKSSKLGTTKRSDGKTQVTYAGHPLYYFVQDKDAGDAYGQGSTAFGAKWYVMSASGNKVTAAATTTSSSSSGSGGY